MTPSTVIIFPPYTATPNNNCVVASVTLAHIITMEVLEITNWKWPGFQLNIFKTLIFAILGLSSIQSGDGRESFGLVLDWKKSGENFERRSRNFLHRGLVWKVPGDGQIDSGPRFM